MRVCGSFSYAGNKQLEELASLNLNFCIFSDRHCKFWITVASVSGKFGVFVRKFRGTYSQGAALSLLQARNSLALTSNRCRAITWGLEGRND